jgi:hypothetical protein
VSFNPYEVLGVPPTASAEEITAAYRRAAAAAHPDRAGGSTERMTDVNMAYKILNDREAKARYDRGEGVQSGPGIDDRARDLLLQLLRTVIRSLDPRMDLLAALRTGVEVQAEGVRQARASTVADLEKVRTIARRLRGPPENPLHTLLASEIARGEALLPRFDTDEAMLARCLELLSAYQYDAGGEDALVTLFGPWSTVSAGR